MDLDQETLECHVCMEIFTKEVFQCSEGHMICHICMEKFAAPSSACPVCDVPMMKNKTRRMFIEDVCRNARIYCRSNGCEFVGCKKDLSEHWRACRHRQTVCPFYGGGGGGNNNGPCAWRGKRVDVEKHLIDLHSEGRPSLKKLPTVEESKCGYAAVFRPGSKGANKPTCISWQILERGEDERYLLYINWNSCKNKINVCLIAIGVTSAENKIAMILVKGKHFNCSELSAVSPRSNIMEAVELKERMSIPRRHVMTMFRDVAENEPLTAERLDFLMYVQVFKRNEIKM